jgi:preprotein translocase subunit SecE
VAREGLMKGKAETGKPPIVNTLLLSIATVLLIAAVGAYYWFQDLAITPVRVVALIAVAGIASFIAAQSDSGAAFFRFLKEADIERRKVVWPTHQETLQTSLMVIIVVILISLFLAGIDWLLGAAVRSLVGG